MRALTGKGYENILIRTHKELDLIRQEEVEEFFRKEKPDYVFLAAARVGGIQANISYPAEFIYENLAIQTNVIHASYTQKVKKLLFLGSACMYPRISPQPMKEDYLLSGYLEPTNKSYAVAKISGLEMCKAYNQQYNTNFICAIPSNIYGPGDHFASCDSHVVPGLIHRFHQAKLKSLTSIDIWGTGKARREFIFVDDVADACLSLVEKYNQTAAINVGCGEDVSIKELVRIIKETISFEGKIIFDESKPDGIPQKLLDNSKIAKLGWKAKVSLEEGIRRTYELYKERIK